MNKKIAFIGCGNMGEALLKGILKRGLFKGPAVTISDKRAARSRYIQRLYRVKVTSSNAVAVKKSDIALLAVKPQDMASILGELCPFIKNKLIITIAAGITTGYIKRISGARKVIRAMPNTPALTGCGVSALSAVKGVSTSDIRVADKIFSCVGEILHLREGQIDSVTAMSGSGPAYFFLLMEAMIKAGVSLGLSKAVAERLTLKTAFGAVTLQQAAQVHPSLLREKVTSKGGTTEAALSVFKSRRFDNIVEEAVKAARRRAGELSR